MSRREADLAEQAKKKAGVRALMAYIEKTTGTRPTKQAVGNWPPIPRYLHRVVEHYVQGVPAPMRDDDTQWLHDFARIVLKTPGLKELLRRYPHGVEDQRAVSKAIERLEADADG